MRHSRLLDLICNNLAVLVKTGHHIGYDSTLSIDLKISEVDHILHSTHLEEEENEDCGIPGLILNLSVLGRRLDMNLIGCSIQGLCRSVADIN